MASLSTWIAACRPKTLPAAAAPVLVGTSLAWADQQLHVAAAVLCGISAICIQIGTNLYNDVADFEKGSDTLDRLGPMRVTAAGLVSPLAMKRATAVAFGAAVASGAYLMWRGGWPIIMVGVLSIAFGLLYTAGKRSLASLGLADLFVFVFFGPVAVGGTYYVQALELTMDVILAGVGPGALSVAILLVNNIRDLEEDSRTGKRTLIVRMGRTWGRRLYGLCLALAAAMPLVLVARRPEEWAALASLAVLPIGVRVRSKLRQEIDGSTFNALLARTAQVLLLYSLLFSVGWAI